MTPDPTLIEQAARRLLEWCDGEHPSASTPGEDIRVVASAYLATLQGSAALPSEAMPGTAAERAAYLLDWDAKGGWATNADIREAIRTVSTFAMRATTPTAPDQDTGASVPDQALAVPVEPVARLDPSGFDPSRGEQ